MNITLSNKYHILERPKAKYFIYSKEELDESLYEIKDNNFYFTKEIDIDSLENIDFYARMNLYEEI